MYCHFAGQTVISFAPSNNAKPMRTSGPRMTGAEMGDERMLIIAESAWTCQGRCRIRGTRDRDESRARRVCLLSMLCHSEYNSTLSKDLIQHCPGLLVFGCRKCLGSQAAREKRLLRYDRSSFGHSEQGRIESEALVAAELSNNAVRMSSVARKVP